MDFDDLIYNTPGIIQRFFRKSWNNTRIALNILRLMNIRIPTTASHELVDMLAAKAKIFASMATMIRVFTVEARISLISSTLKRLC